MALRPSRRTIGSWERVGPLDVAFGLVVVVVAALEVWIPALGPGGQWAAHRPVLTAAAVLAGAALIIRRAAPVLTLALVLAAVQAQIWLAGTESVTGLAAVLVALFTVGATTDRRPALLGLAVAVWWVLLGGEDLADHSFGLLLVGGPWVAGRLVRGRQLLLDELGRRNAELEVEQRKTALLAVVEERARIARDMHDVIAHSLTVMVIQAQAAAAQLASPRADVDRAVEALTAVEEVGRSALREARRLVGALAEDGEAPVSPLVLSDVEALVETVRSTGQPVSLTVAGERRALPRGVDVNGYRVVQEALTNTLKHAGGARAVVRVTYRREAVDVEVVDEGAGPAVSSGGAASGGRGLQGMRHRVESCGGRLTVEAPAGGGFVVAACFPTAQATVVDAAQGSAR